MSSRKSTDPKLEAMLAEGTANPRPKDVSDAAFQDSEFFDPRDLVQVKYEMLRRVRLEGRTVANAAASFGVSRPTFYKAQADFARAGAAGLLPSKRGPQGPHKVTAKVMDFITRALAKDPNLNVGELVDRVDAHLGVRLHRRTIERALARSKKKTAPPDAAVTVALPAPTLITAYERLRHEAMEPSARGGLQGLAILARKGMAGWIHACTAAAASPRDLPPPTPATATLMPPNVQREVVDVLAAMALTRTTEVWS